MADFYGTPEVVTDLREDGVLIMRINRPEKRNAINAVTSAAMEEIMNKAEKYNRVRVIIVTGRQQLLCLLLGQRVAHGLKLLAVRRDIDRPLLMDRLEGIILLLSVHPVHTQRADGRNGAHAGGSVDDGFSNLEHCWFSPFFCGSI